MPSSSQAWGIYFILFIFNILFLEYLTCPKHISSFGTQLKNGKYLLDKYKWMCLLVSVHFDTWTSIYHIAHKHFNTRFAAFKDISLNLNFQLIHESKCSVKRASAVLKICPLDHNEQAQENIKTQSSCIFSRSLRIKVSVMVSAMPKTTLQILYHLSAYFIETLWGDIYIELMCSCVKYMYGAKKRCRVGKENKDFYTPTTSITYPCNFQVVCRQILLWC